MKRFYAVLLLLVLGAFSCTKSKTTVNNYTSLPGGNTPAFSVNGLSDITLTNLFSHSYTLYINVTYQDSAQENVTLSLSGLPQGITMDTSWIHSGIPSFNTSITFYDTTAAGATPGTYPITLTATTASGNKKFYTVNLNVLPMPTQFLGSYDSCFLYCGPTQMYSDSVYLDASIPNKIWFANFANSGHHVYGIISTGGQLTIPAQTFGANTYSGSGSLSPVHVIDISISGSCAINMFNH